MALDDDASATVAVLAPVGGSVARGVPLTISDRELSADSLLVRLKRALRDALRLARLVTLTAGERETEKVFAPVALTRALPENDALEEDDGATGVLVAIDGVPRNERVGSLEALPKAVSVGNSVATPLCDVRGVCVSELRVDGDDVIVTVAVGVNVAVTHAVIDRCELALTPDVTVTVRVPVADRETTRVTVDETLGAMVNDMVDDSDANVGKMENDTVTVAVKDAPALLIEATNDGPGVGVAPA